jgi:hypothetical protein
MTVPPRTAGRIRHDKRPRGPRVPRPVLLGPLAVLAALATALAATAPFAPAATARTTAQAPAPAAKLVCAAATEPGRPVTFTPAVGLLPAPVDTKGTLRLSSCTSPDGSQSRLRSGRLTMKGSGRASCTGVSGLRSQGTITWYDSRGRTAGTSKIRSASRELSGTNPADALLAGKVVSGPMKGRHVTGSATPTTDLTSCTVSGVSAVEGSGRLTVS